ncbi:MAG TPA: Rieske (2Fe-2S) protein [Planctomycetota bacterium]|nr:Rieske (2Fe-2S) protein [Planctomycetota bacterium]
MEESPAWKDDFPISWVDDHYVTRREFTKSLVLLSCAAFCANGALVAMDLLEKHDRAGAIKPLKIGRVQDLKIGESRVFDYPAAGEPCLLVRLDEDRFAAFSQKCTHLGCPVLYRQEARKLYCPCHEGYFNAEDGKVAAGPPPRPLPRVDLRRDGDEIWAMGFLK